MASNLSLKPSWIGNGIHSLASSLRFFLWLQVSYALVGSVLYGQTLSGKVLGRVLRDGDEQPVKARLTAMGSGVSDTFWTDDDGKFSMSMPPYAVGYQYRITVAGWIVDAPCSPPRGAFNMPRAGGDPVLLYVSPQVAKPNLPALTCSMKIYAFAFPAAESNASAWTGRSKKPLNKVNGIKFSKSNTTRAGLFG